MSYSGGWVSGSWSQQPQQDDVKYQSHDDDEVQRDVDVDEDQHDSNDNLDAEQQDNDDEEHVDAAEQLDAYDEEEPRPQYELRPSPFVRLSLAAKFLLTSLHRCTTSRRVRPARECHLDLCGRYVQELRAVCISLM
jgi:hypothetical protein